MNERLLTLVATALALSSLAGCTRPAPDPKTTIVEDDPWAGKPVQVEFKFEGVVAFVAKGREEAGATAAELFALLPDATERNQEVALRAGVAANRLNDFYCGRSTPMEGHFAQIGIPFRYLDVSSDLAGTSELLVNLNGSDPFDRSAMGALSTFDISLDAVPSSAPVALKDFEKLTQLRSASARSHEASKAAKGALVWGSHHPGLAARFRFAGGERFEAARPLEMEGKKERIPYSWAYRQNMAMTRLADGPTGPETWLQGKVIAERIGSPTLVVRSAGRSWQVKLKPDGAGRVELSVRNLRGVETLTDHGHAMLGPEARRTADGCEVLEHAKLYHLITVPMGDAKTRRYLYPTLDLEMRPGGFCVPVGRMDAE